MGDDADGRYSATEVFAVILVLADIPVIAVAVVAGPLYAVGLAAVLVFGGLGAWYLNRRLDAEESGES